MFAVHLTGKRPLVFISTIGAGLCFLGTATYAHYLNLVPGAAVSNVVSNASAINLGNATLITDVNVTDTLYSLMAANQTQANDWNNTQTIETNSFDSSAEADGTMRNDTENNFLTTLKKHVNTTKSNVLLDVPDAEDNQFLWLPLTLLLLVALFGHVGIRLIPWMLIGEVSYFSFLLICDHSEFICFVFLVDFSRCMSKRCIRSSQWCWLRLRVFS